MENNKPKVSVIVTTYNREKYLKETIQSILNQTFADFELIVVDNFSNYNFFEVIESFNDPRIRPFQNQNNGIIAVNRNFGLKHAVGEYVAFCDDDDLWRKDKLEVQISCKHIDNTIICTSCVLIDNQSSEFKNIKRRPYRNKYQLYVSSRISLSSVFIKNSSLIRFDEDCTLVGIEDWALWLKLISSGYDIYTIDEPLLLYRFAGENFSNNKLLRPIKQIYCLCRLVLNGYPVKNKNFFVAILYNLAYYIYYNIKLRK